VNGTPPALRVEADLAIEVDGRSAHLRGDGSTLVLTSAHPESLWAVAGRTALPTGVGVASGPRAIALVADRLAAAGLRLEVMGPQGRVVRLGDGVQSVLGRVTTGSSAVGPGRPRALAVVLWHGQRRVFWVAGLVVGAAVLAVWVGARRR